MPRALRLEFEHASYHLINRGNYRAPIFADPDTKRAFLRCLDETCRKTHWVVHAWCLMSNHYHLAATTPDANLSAGMHALQTTFATRFNVFRNERGHVFQNRFKSLAVEDGDALGSVCHYIHLNPVRAGLCPADELHRYPWTSLAWIVEAENRPAWFDPVPALRHAGGLSDIPTDHLRYRHYLSWLAEDKPEQKRLRFDRMCRGWAVGTPEFARRLITEAQELQGDVRRLISDMRAEYEAHWQAELDALLRRLDRTLADLHASGKSAEWKVALAAALKSRTTVTNRWLSQHLHLGNRHEIGRKVAAWRRSPDPELLRRLDIPTPHNPAP